MACPRHFEGKIDLKQDQNPETLFQYAVPTPLCHLIKNFPFCKTFLFPSYPPAAFPSSLFLPQLLPLTPPPSSLSSLSSTTAVPFLLFYLAPEPPLNPPPPSSLYLARTAALFPFPRCPSLQFQPSRHRRLLPCLIPSRHPPSFSPLSQPRSRRHHQPLTSPPAAFPSFLFPSTQPSPFPPNSPSPAPAATTSPYRRLLPFPRCPSLQFQPSPPATSPSPSLPFPPFSLFTFSPFYLASPTFPFPPFISLFSRFPPTFPPKQPPSSLLPGCSCYFLTAVYHVPFQFISVLCFNLCYVICFSCGFFFLVILLYYFIAYWVDCVTLGVAFGCWY